MPERTLAITNKHSGIILHNPMNPSNSISNKGLTNTHGIDIFRPYCKSMHLYSGRTKRSGGVGRTFSVVGEGGERAVGRGGGRRREGEGVVKRGRKEWWQLLALGRLVCTVVDV